jgi:hypothetical protein
MPVLNAQAQLLAEGYLRRVLDLSSPGFLQSVLAEFIREGHF